MLSVWPSRQRATLAILKLLPVFKLFAAAVTDRIQARQRARVEKPRITKKMRAVLCANGCLHSVFDLLHLFGAVHVAVAALLGVHKSTGVLNENLQQSRHVGGSFADAVHLRIANVRQRGAHRLHAVTAASLCAHLSGKLGVECFLDGHILGVVTSSTAVGDFHVDGCHFDVVCKTGRALLRISKQCAVNTLAAVKMGLGGWHLVSLGSILIQNATHLDGVKQARYTP